MKKNIYQIALTLIVLSFLSGTSILIAIVWFEDILGETSGKLLVTSGIVFIASAVAAIFLRESNHDDKLKKEGFIN